MDQLTREDVIRYVGRCVKELAADLRKKADVFLPWLLKAQGVETYDISNLALNEAVFNCAKDLEKLALYQDDQVDELKTFGYFAFWIRKIKPVTGATLVGGRPLKDVNERLSVWLLGAIVTRYLKGLAGSDPIKLAEVNDVARRFEKLMADDTRMKYLIHCMRARTFGPHHYVILLQQIVHGL